MLRILRIALMGQLMCITIYVFHAEIRNINFVVENKKKNLGTAMSILWKAKSQDLSRWLCNQSLAGMVKTSADNKLMIIGFDISGGDNSHGMSNPNFSKNTMNVFQQTKLIFSLLYPENKAWFLLWRQFIWNVKPSFLRRISPICYLLDLPSER